MLPQIARDLAAMGQAHEAVQQLDPILKPPAIGNDVIRARALAIRGQYASAEKDLRDAIATFQRYGLPVDEFDAWLALAHSDARARESRMPRWSQWIRHSPSPKKCVCRARIPSCAQRFAQPLQPAFDLEDCDAGRAVFRAARSIRPTRAGARERIARLALGTAERSRSRALADFQTLDLSAPNVPPELRSAAAHHLSGAGGARALR